MSMIRWRPTRDIMRLRDEFDHLFEDSFDFPRWRRMDHFSGPSLDVAETDDNYIVKASLPGVKADDLDISVTGNILTIKGQVEDEKDINEEQYHLRERRYGSFARTVALPASVDSESIEANYEDGVLTLTAPKTEVDKRKRITVNSNGSTKVLEGKTKK